MTSDDFTCSLRTARLGHRVTWFDVTDSTNNRAADAITAGRARDGDVFIAGAQTAGRGTGGRAWASAEPVGLWMSLVLFEPLRATPLSLLPAIALASVLRRDLNVPAHLKWPNDVLVGAGDAARKIAGILTERHPTAPAWIVGVGVNVSQPTFAGTPLDGAATSIRMAGGREAPLDALLGALLAEMERVEASLTPPPRLASGSPCPAVTSLPSLWCELSRMPGRTVRLRRAGTGADAPAGTDVGTGAGADAGTGAVAGAGAGAGGRGIEQHVCVTGLDAAGHLQMLHPDGRCETVAGVSGLKIDPRY